jgi:hypothetical protein
MRDERPAPSGAFILLFALALLVLVPLLLIAWALGGFR